MSGAVKGFDSMRMKAGLRNFCARFGRADKGTTAIEFAMVIGPFLALLFAIIETSLIYFAEFTVDAAVQNASRKIRTGAFQKGHYSASEFKKVVCSDLPAFIVCDNNVMVDVRAFDTFGQAAGDMPNPLRSDGSINANFSKFQMGGASQVVVVSIFYRWTLMAKFPGLGDFTGKLGLGMGNLPDGSRLIAATTAFQTEAYQ